MSTLFQLPPDWSQAAPILEQQLQQIQSTLLKSAGTNKRPQPPRNLIAQAGSLEVYLTWNAPQSNSDIAGWRVYRDNESTLALSISDASTRQARIKVPANTPVGFYVSSVNANGVESSKVFIVGKANTDQYVTSGTTGGTGGSAPPPPPGYPSEPTGGGRKQTFL